MQHSAKIIATIPTLFSLSIFALSRNKWKGEQKGKYKVKQKFREIAALFGGNGEGGGGLAKIESLANEVSAAELKCFWEKNIEHTLTGTLSCA